MKMKKNILWCVYYNKDEILLLTYWLKYFIIAVEIALCLYMESRGKTPVLFAEQGKILIIKIKNRKRGGNEKKNFVDSICIIINC